jgi:hypothetical protein
MNLKKVVFATMTLAMVSGSAVAGSTSALDDPAKMSPFWAAMSQEDRDAIMKDCADATIAKAHENFCKMAMMMGK